MSAAGRSAITLAVLATIVLAWVVYGLSATTRPFPGRAEAPTCVETTYSAGDRLTPAEVTVSVLNAGSREGLAGRTMQLFVDAGFGQGDSGNAPTGTRVQHAQIWTSTPDDPAVRLVASRIAKVRIVDQPTSAAGITLVVGDRFEDLVEGRARIRVRDDVVVCGPLT